MTAAGSTAAAPPPGLLNRRVLAVGLVFVIPLLVVLLLNLGRDPHSVRSPLVGRAAPPFTMTPAGGGAPVSLESLRGRPVVLNFWATWCAPCIQEHPALNGAAAARTDVAFLGVVYQDEEERIREFQRRYGSAYPSLLDPDGKTAIAYGIAGVPETFFIDTKGTIVAKVSLPLSADEIRQHLEKAAR
jgi:cytochrome c biogenesis protein CcmG, thiol:disulfide interchange protein DsbE